MVLAGAVFPAFPVRDLLTGQSFAGARLERPLSYVLTAPLSNILDALTLLSLSQHAALIATLMAVSGALLVARGRSGRRSGIRSMAIAPCVTVALYAAAIAAPRPMAALRLADPSLISVDFHSHTNASHDARTGFTAEANREWHRLSGYDAAYISDHHSFRGVDAALSANPAVAGASTMLLPALEASYQEEHVIVLGSAHDAGTAPVRQWAGGQAPRDNGAGLVLTIPGSVRAFNHSHGRRAEVLGIELSDGSPRGLGEGDDKRDAIVALATKLGASLLTGSDNHGWGRTAVAWSVMTIPGWRALSADSLDARIRTSLRASGTRAVRPLARNRVSSASGALPLAMTAPAVAWLMMRTLSWPERLSWIAWCVAIALLSGALSRRRHRGTPVRLHVVRAGATG